MIYGKNNNGDILKSGDMIKCGNGLDTWITHVQFDFETNKWHRESDYHTGLLIGSYA